MHLDQILFKQAVQYTADQMKIPAIYIEKDYWVTYALYNIFKNEIDSILHNFDLSLSTYNPSSIISKINTNQKNVKLDNYFITCFNKAKV